MREHPRILARRYARALFEVARGEGAAVEAPLRGQLESFVRLLETNRQLQSTLANPALAPELRRRVLDAVGERARLAPLLSRLIRLLLEHEQLELLPALAEAYAEERNAAAGIVSATAVSAVPLDDAQKKALANALCDAVGRRVELKGEVDAGLLGGILVRVAGRTYDGSVRGRLAALRRRLAAGD